MQSNPISRLKIAGAPDIPELSFRHFRGPDDYPHMVRIITDSKDEDQIERVDTVEMVTQAYAHLSRSDPYQDMIFAEIAGNPVAYSRLWWEQEKGGTIVYSFFNFLVPAWRGCGIRTAMVRWIEDRACQIAGEHDPEAPKLLGSWASESETDMNRVLADAGYQPVRWFFDMVRPDLENVPDLPLPPGVEVRPVKSEHYRAVFEANFEAFQDHWGAASELDEARYQEWLTEPYFQPNLWQIAWDGDEVVGMVQNFINEAENEEYHRRRGWTEDIAVRRLWRRQGVASALIARSLKVLKEQGMTEAALGVDSENTSGALSVYQKLGFQAVKTSVTYRKPLRLSV